MTAPSHRPARLHAADRIACPRCSAPIRRLTAGAGAFVATCDAKQAVRPGERFGRPCGQPSYVSTDREGVSTVLPLERAELEILTGRPSLPGIRETLELLGVLRQRSPDAIPSHPCASCEKPTSLVDLYAGHCRACAGLGNGRQAAQEGAGATIARGRTR